jgi:hypothetical protein
MIEVRLPQGSRSREQEGIEGIAVTPRLPMTTKWLRRQRIVARPRPASDIKTGVMAGVMPACDGAAGQALQL